MMMIIDNMRKAVKSGPMSEIKYLLHLNEPGKVIKYIMYQYRDQQVYGKNQT